MNRTNINYDWHEYFNYNIESSVEKRVLQFHGKTVWFNNKNKANVLPHTVKKWVSTVQGENGDNTPSVYEESVDLFSEKVNNLGSKREFISAAIDKKMLSTILSRAFHQNDNNYSRRYASAGALYPVSPFLFVFKAINDIDPGIYFIPSREDKLYRIKRLSESNVQKIISVIDFTGEKGQIPSDLAIGYALNMNKTVAKYSYRGYRHGLIEVGTMSQAFRETCHELNFGEFSSSAFDDLILTRLSGLSVRDFPIILIQWFGKYKRV